MASNLPPGLSESQIPGCRPEDKAIDLAIDDKLCEACKHYNDDGYTCEECVNALEQHEYFEAEEDEALILERLQAAAEAREDGHIDG